MKNIIFISTCLLLGFSSCRYDEPVFSFRSPEYRLLGSWTLQNVYMNGEKIVTTSYDANIPFTSYSFYVDGLLTVSAYVDGVLERSSESSWAFLDKNTRLHIYIRLKNKKYDYEADIIKLSTKELKYSYTDKLGNQWQLEMFSTSNK